VKWVGVISLVLWGGLAPAAQGKKVEVAVSQARRALEAWDVRQAAEALAPYSAEPARRAEVAAALARVAFYQGDYARAEALYDEALRQEPGRVRWQATRALVRSTREVTAGYQQVSSSDRRVIVRYEPGKDAVLVPLVLDAVGAAIREIGGDLGFVPDTPVLVEIYSSPETLAKVSPLTEREIETSGTIALCKYNRLMLTSPRALLRGYPWLDSLAHEFVHYAVTRVSQNTVPIWLHEGLAKWQERRWRGTTERRLQPSAEHLLAEGLRQGRLITFEEMHPSMAKLPSQDAAALAFAEVFTVVDYLHQRVGLSGIRRILALLREGKSDAEAISAVSRMSFAAFKGSWMRYLRRLKPRLHPGIVAERVVFKKKGKRKPDDLREIEMKRARELTHLGELLRQRGHLRAAVVEYQKALRLAKNRYPVIQTKLARALLGLRRPREAVQALEATLPLYPGFPATYTYLGEAYQALGETDRAIGAFEEANRLNPFDPRVYEALWELHRRKQDPVGAERAARNLRVLRGESGDDPWAPQTTLGR
jgi:tetratricopeptide (TPR) repeat protein